MANKNIKALSASQMYQGKITITLYKGKKAYKTIKTHNYGTAAFFEYIWGCVMGQNLTSSVPSYIYACSDDNGAVPLTNFGVLTEGIPSLTVNNASDESNSSATLTYIFLIPGTIVNNDTIKSFILKDLQNSKVYAVVSLDEEIKIENVDSNTNISVEWSLILSNGSIDDEEI